MTLTIALHNTIHLPKEIGSLVSEYAGKKYVKIQQKGSWWDKICATAYGVHEAAYANNIPGAIRAIEQNGWIDRVVTSIAPLIQKGQWDAIEFLFSQHECLEDGLAEPFGPQLWLGQPLRHNTIYGKDVFKHHPGFMFEGNKSSETYYKLMNLWLTYKPLLDYRKGSEHWLGGGSALVFKHVASTGRILD